MLALALIGLVALMLARRPAGLPTPAAELTSWSGATMGTTYSVKIDADISDAEVEEIGGEIERLLERMNALMSTYDTSSQLSRLNRHEEPTPFPVDPEVVEVLSLAQDVGRRSDGLFDVTVGPLVDAWGFGPIDGETSPPSGAALAMLAPHVGADGLRVDTDEGTVTKAHPAVRIDLSAIAKGYAVDILASALERRGYPSFLVEVGGELKAGARKRDGSLWTIGVEWPEAMVRSVYATAQLEHRAIATSGDYRNLVSDRDQYRTHLIDPRTGVALPFTGASVTVVHDDAASADAWATALSVGGFEDGYDLAVREGLAALFLRIQAEGVEARATPLFLERVAEFSEVDRR